MGLHFHFTSQAGRQVLPGGGEGAIGTEVAPEEAIAALQGLLDELELPVKGLELEAEGERVVVRGHVPSLELREKVVLALGNVRGISLVDDGLLVEGGKAPFAGESDFYAVQEGDTLRGIAQRHYQDAQRDELILEANRPILDDPQRLSPGMLLRIPR